MTRPELLGVLAIIGVIIGFSYFNFQIAEVRAHDETRKSDLGHIRAGLEDYNKDHHGVFPLSREGKILACGDINQPEAVCQWGTDNLGKYLTPIPQDPLWFKGFSFFYLSNGKQMQIFAYLDDKGSAQGNPIIEEAKLPCGKAICNYGIAAFKQPIKEILKVDRSVDN